MGVTKLAAVKYHNTLPLLNGLQQSELSASLELRMEHPAKCARLLRERNVDIALCPIGALLDFDEYHIVTDFGIGCDGPVRTVAIYSQRPISELKYIVLYRESRTSNLLAQVMEHDFWHYGLEFCSEPPLGVDEDMVGYLCIGDQCFDMERRYAHACDLGAAWKQHTGLPFVFACWTSLSPVADELVMAMNTAFHAGVQGIGEMPLGNGNSNLDIRHYLLNNIDFDLTKHKRKAMQLFLNAARKLPILSPYVTEDPLG